MTMHNPPHPGEFIRAVYLQPLGLTGRQLDVSPSTVARLLAGKSDVSPEMALRLAKTLGRSAESWLAMQQHRDLWRARQTLDLSRVEALPVDAA